MATLQDIIDDARVLLNDKNDEAMGFIPRYTESQLLRYAKQAIMEARRIRPDLFIENLSDTFTDLTLTSAFPMPEEYEIVVVDFVVGRAEFRDDEFTNDGRAAALMQRFKQHLLGIA